MRTISGVRLLLMTSLLATGGSRAKALTAGYESVSSRSSESIRVAGAGSWRVASDGTRTTVGHADATGSWSVSVPGRFRLPVVTSRGLRAGPSLDGAALVLASLPQQGPSSWHSAFVVVTRSANTTLPLSGRWMFDAVSPNGQTLFLTESVGPNRYWVRPVDVATGRIGDRLVTKSIAAAPTRVAVEDGPMEGLPIDRVTSPDGHVVFTLYDGPAHPFVHALDTQNGGAICYDLPQPLQILAGALRLRLGPDAGTVDVVHNRRVVVQVTGSSSRWGPSVKTVDAKAPQ